MFKLAGLLSSLIIMIASWHFINKQQERILSLQESNAKFTQQINLLKTNLENVRQRETSLSAALTGRQQSQHRLEENYEQLRNQLHQSMVQSPCADQPVPNNVIQLQRKAFRGGDAPR